MTTRSLRPPNFQKCYFCLTDWRLKSTHRITENKKRQFDNFIVIGGTASCHYDNLECHQWRQIVKLRTLCFQWWDGFFRQLFLIIHLDSFCLVNPLAGPSSKLGHQRFIKLAWPPGATFNKISLKINQFSSKKCTWIYCTNYRPFCLGRCDIYYIPWNMHTTWSRFVLLWWYMYFNQFTVYFLMLGLKWGCTHWPLAFKLILVIDGWGISDSVDLLLCHPHMASPGHNVLIN